MNVKKIIVYLFIIFFMIVINVYNNVHQKCMEMKILFVNFVMKGVINVKTLKMILVVNVIKMKVM